MASRNSLQPRSATFGTGTMERNTRTVTFLALEDAEQYPAGILMALLMAIAFTEGADGVTFPSVLKALETTVGFDALQVGTMATVQLLFQALAGPIWGTLASRGTMSRMQILCLGTFLQGLATLVMWPFITVTWLVYVLRAINGIALASLRPIANSIVGDRFDDAMRGKMFSWIGFALQMGSALTGFVGTGISTELLFGDETVCPTPYLDDGDPKKPVWRGMYNATGDAFPSTWGCFYGWKMTFVVVGLLTMLLSPAVYFLLKAPPVKQDSNAKAGEGSGEMKKICGLLKKKSFAIIVFQGMFGLLPWRSFEFRTFFFQSAGLSNAASGALNSVGIAAAAGGNLLGGFVGDTFALKCPTHGRIFAAEISVYSGIPIAWVTFLVLPETVGLPPAIYYGGLVAALGIMAAWTEPATINPTLCALAKDDERALILSLQTSLQGAVGSLGPILFTAFAAALGFNQECARENPMERPIECRENYDAVGIVGYALFLCSVIPWTCCGLLYTSLHATYPADIQQVQMEAAMREAGEGGSELGVRQSYIPS